MVRGTVFLNILVVLGLTSVSHSLTCLKVLQFRLSYNPISKPRFRVQLVTLTSKVRSEDPAINPIHCILCTWLVQNPGGAWPTALLLFLPVNPSISHMIHASLQNDFMAGLLPQMGGCWACRNWIEKTKMVVYTSIFNTWKLLTCKWKFQKPNNPIKI